MNKVLQLCRPKRIRFVPLWRQDFSVRTRWRPLHSLSLTSVFLFLWSAKISQLCFLPDGMSKPARKFVWGTISEQRATATYCYLFCLIFVYLHRSGLMTLLVFFEWKFSMKQQTTNELLKIKGCLYSPQNRHGEKSDQKRGEPPKSKKPTTY